MYLSETRGIGALSAVLADIEQVRQYLRKLNVLTTCAYMCLSCPDWGIWRDPLDTSLLLAGV